MAEFAFSKSLIAAKKRSAITRSNIAYALFVLFCFWAGTQLLNMLVHAPGVYEHLMQVQDTGRPRVEIGLGVSTVFGLIPFLAGSMVLGVIALVLRLQSHTASPTIVHAFCEPCGRQVTRDLRAFKLNAWQNGSG